MSARLERLAAACILPGFPGLEPPEWVRRRLAGGLGGVVLFAWNVRDAEQVAALTAALRSERPEAVVAIDEEGGDVTRLEAAAGSSYPGSYALGAVDDVELTRRVAGAIARDLAVVGVTLNLAPVADVNSNPLNPVIGIRAFGSDPELVARHVAAFVEGTQRAGMAACAKHFPGHGDTVADSHLELPTAQGDLAAALVPFRAAVEAGVAAVMTAHIRVPALDEAPATLSPAIVEGLLRRELGFDGLVISDALEMRAISATVGVEEGAVQALSAGVDALCLGHDLGDEAVEAVQRAVVDAVRSGRLGEERLAEAAARVGVASRAPGGVAAGHDGAVGLDAARRALLAEGVARLSTPPLVVELRPEPSIAAGEAGIGLGEALRRRRAETAVVELRGPASDARELVRHDPERPLVVVLRDAHRHHWQQLAACELLAVRPDATVVETGLPEWRPPGGAYLATRGAGRVNLEAAAELLL